jgi:hypothetical protein
MYNMASQTQKFKAGDKVSYRDIDMEYYSRGYGVIYETKTAQVIELYYKLSNGECVAEEKLSLVTKEPSQVSEATKEPSPTKETSLSETQTPPSNGQ